jgi:hypothetical protein
MELITKFVMFHSEAEPQIEGQSNYFGLKGIFGLFGVHFDDLLNDLINHENNFQWLLLMELQQN